MSRRTEGEGPAPEAGQDVRCDCGRLLARIVPDGVEIRCSRCKRAVVLPIAPESRSRPLGDES